MQDLTDAQLLQAYYAAGVTLSEIANNLDWSSGQRVPAVSSEERNAEQTENACQAEIERRFGPGAVDRLAEYFTATRANPQEMLADATLDPGLLVKEATRPATERISQAEMAWADSKFYGHA